MKKAKKKRKTLTPSSLIGLFLGMGLMIVGLYYAIGHDSPGAYFVVFIGLLFNGLIFLIHRG